MYIDPCWNDNISLKLKKSPQGKRKIIIMHCKLKIKITHYQGQSSLNSGVVLILKHNGTDLQALVDRVSLSGLTSGVGWSVLYVGLHCIWGVL